MTARGVRETQEQVCSLREGELGAALAEAGNALVDQVHPKVPGSTSRARW